MMELRYRKTWRLDKRNSRIIKHKENNNIVGVAIGRATYGQDARIMAAAPEMFNLLLDELFPSSNCGGLIDPSREIKIRTLLEWISEGAFE